MCCTSLPTYRADGADVESASGPDDAEAPKRPTAAAEELEDLYFALMDPANTGYSYF